ncbi:hypothetical protein [Saccharothrix deserti]|uniref:hypothetical protein n=1 Tax=Saccharothrix deserti TaxID=2593674 RepID=UPI00131C0E0B|nr:hypothetical protein [Saccharothrix deserti]
MRTKLAPVTAAVAVAATVLLAPMSHADQPQATTSLGGHAPAGCGDSRNDTPRQIGGLGGVLGGLGVLDPLSGVLGGILGGGG